MKKHSLEDLHGEDAKVEKMTILGVDLATYNTGFAFVSFDKVSNNFERIQSGTIQIKKTKKTATIASRIRQTRDELDVLIHETNPDCVALEESFAGPNRKTGIQLAMIHGAILDLFERKGVPVVYYAPSTIKKAVKKGNAKKEEVEEEVRRIFDLEDYTFQTDDEPDALAIAYTYIKKELSP